MLSAVLPQPGITAVELLKDLFVHMYSRLAYVLLWLPE